MAVRSLMVAALLPAAVTMWAVASIADSDGPDDPEVHARIDGPVLTSDAQWHGGMTALIRGRVQLVDDCLRLGGSAVIWPTGTTWDDATQSVRLPDGSLVSLGTTVSGGGGSLSATDIAEIFDEELAEAVRECALAGDPGANVFNTGDVLDIR